MERLEHFLSVNGNQSTAKKRAVLLTVLGSETYEVLHNHLFPEKPSDKMYIHTVGEVSLQKPKQTVKMVVRV